MSCKSIILKIFTQTILLIGTPHAVVAAEFRSSDRVYVAASIGIVRTAPKNDAPIAARIPIGTSGEFRGFPSDVALGPNNECPGAEASGDMKWSCVTFDRLVLEENSSYWSGWIATDLLSGESPKLKDLLLKYDNTAADNLSERRKWAERAAALDPTSTESQERLLDVLSKMDDTKALEAASRSFAIYRSGQLRSNSAKKLVFVFKGDLWSQSGSSKRGASYLVTSPKT